MLGGVAKMMTPDLPESFSHLYRRLERRQAPARHPVLSLGQSVCRPEKTRFLQALQSATSAVFPRTQVSDITLAEHWAPPRYSKCNRYRERTVGSDILRLPGAVDGCWSRYSLAGSKDFAVRSP